MQANVPDRFIISYAVLLWFPYRTSHHALGHVHQFLASELYSLRIAFNTNQPTVLRVLRNPHWYLILLLYPIYWEKHQFIYLLFHSSALFIDQINFTVTNILWITQSVTESDSVCNTVIRFFSGFVVMTTTHEILGLNREGDVHLQLLHTDIIRCFWSNNV